MFVHPTHARLRGPDEHYLWNTVGNPIETTVTAAHLVMAGVIERHPDLRVAARPRRRRAAGAARPAAPRARVPAARARAAARVAVEASLRRFYFDTVTHDPALLRALVDFAGADRVLLGSDHPFDMADPDPVATVRAAGLGPRPSGDPRRQRGGAARHERRDRRSSSPARATTA